MKTLLKVVVAFALCALVVTLFLNRSQPPQTFVLAPPAPAELGSVTNLAPPPADAVVFDLKYRVQTGGAEDVPYNSYWGFGSTMTEAKTNAFLQAVRQRAAHLCEVQHPMLKGREWAAVEHQRGRALAFYFDLDANGKFSDNERLLPTKKVENRGVQFITPDFKRADGGEMLFRVLLEVNFYGDASTPNCMWSPACLLEGTANIAGKPARLLLFSSGFDGQFTRYGASSFALRLGRDADLPRGQYVARETLSSLVGCDGQFYRLQFEGQRAQGHVARALLIKDTTPTGTLAVKLDGTNALQTELNYLYLQGTDDSNVFLHVEHRQNQLPRGAFTIQRGSANYGRDWEVGFSQGPRVVVEADKLVEVHLGPPVLKVRAIDERERYNSTKNDATVFKQGTRIYLEPAIAGPGQEVFGRFRHKASNGQMTDAPPQVTITGPGGKVLLAKTMEYG